MKLILRIKWENTIKLLTQYLTHDKCSNMSVFQHLLNSKSVPLLAKKKGGYLSHRIAIKLKETKYMKNFTTYKWGNKHEGFFPPLSSD